MYYIGKHFCFGLVVGLNNQDHSGSDMRFVTDSRNWLK